MTQLDRAKQLRKRQTEAEHRLWFHLRAHRFMGYKFKRQAPLGQCIVDFVSMNAGLVIEVDGGQHNEARKPYDTTRDRTLAAKGLRVLRFWNDQVLADTESVLERIRLALAEAPSPPAPLPRAGEGSRTRNPLSRSRERGRGEG